MITIPQYGCFALRLLMFRNVTSMSSRFYSKDDIFSDDEKEIRNKNTKKVAAQEPESETASMRLNRLLVSMDTDNDITKFTSSVSKDMARPGKIHKVKKQEMKDEETMKDVIVAAKCVAALLGDEKKQSESELLSKLLGHDRSEGQTTIEEKNKAESGASLSDIIVGMKVDRTQERQEESRHEFVRRTLAARKQDNTGNRKSFERPSGKLRTPESYTGSVKLFGEERLGIFNDTNKVGNSTELLTTWSELHKNELKILVTHPPTNYFEKMARWTEQKKLWNFPINNEQDMDEEASVDFSDHIFLEQHLESWCPTKGPIRHFMELVCVGLSKNPYISAKEKKEHILWYADYFESKKDLLKDLLGPDQVTTNIKQLES